MTKEMWIDFQHSQQIFLPPQSFQIGSRVKQTGWEANHSPLVPKLRISGVITLLLPYGTRSMNVTFTPISSLPAAFHYASQWDRFG